jgi:hypothetical protein
MERRGCKTAAITVSGLLLGGIVTCGGLTATRVFEFEIQNEPDEKSLMIAGPGGVCAVTLYEMTGINLDGSTYKWWMPQSDCEPWQDP